MTMERLRVVVVPTDGRPREEVLELGPDGSALGRLREIVGGDVGLLSVGAPCEGVDLFVNDEGMFDCPPNRAIYATRTMEEDGLISQVDGSVPVHENEPYAVLHGNIVAAGYDPVSGDTVSLTDAQASETLRYFERVSPAGSGAYEEQLVRSHALARVVDELGLDVSDIYVAMPGEAGPEPNIVSSTEFER